jgi:hypothetical protein
MLAMKFIDPLSGLRDRDLKAGREFAGFVDRFLLLQFGDPGLLDLSFEGFGECFFNGSDGILDGINNTTSGPHRLDCRSVEATDPLAFAESSFVLSIGGEVGKLSFLQEENKYSSVGFSGAGIGQGAEGGFIRETFAEGILDRVHSAAPLILLVS